MKKKQMNPNESLKLVLISKIHNTLNHKLWLNQKLNLMLKNEIIKTINFFIKVKNNNKNEGG
jgi:hypothetical protein